MANNTTPQAINFANERVRPVANCIIQCYNSMIALQNYWTAGNIVSVIPNDANPIQDGATAASGPGDGRAPITDSQVNVMISNLATLLAPFIANSNLILNQMMQMINQNNPNTLSVV